MISDEPFVGDRLQRFPDLAFLQLAVAGHHDDASAAAGAAAARAPCRTPSRCPCPSEPVLVAMNGVVDVGMAGQAAEAPQPVQQIEVELLERDEQRVERRRVVALRREVDVGVRRAAVGIDELLGPEPRDQIDRAEARSDVARSRPA